MSFRTFVSGLNLLRDPSLVRDLGERRLHLNRIAEIQRTFPNTKIHRDLVLIGYRSQWINLGEGASLCEGTVLAFGDDHNGYGRIQIGMNSWIGQYNNLRAGGGDIVIGKGCLISQFCSLVASNHGMEKGVPIQEQAPSVKSGVILEDDVWLGAGVHVLPGVRVRQGAIVGAGSVVSRDIPPNEIWAGTPARKISVRGA